MLAVIVLLVTGCSCGSRDPHGTGVDDTGEVDTADADDTGGGDDTGGSDDTGDPTLLDRDGDGVTEDEDCDDSDATVYPGAPEICGDGVVNDCDGSEAAAQEVCESILTPDQAVASWAIPPIDRHNQLRMAAAGDTNGDGVDDLAFGWSDIQASEAGLSTGAYDIGSVFVFHGPVSGTYEQGDEDAFVAGADSRDSAGWDLLGMGDLDGDGFDDLAVGAADSDDAAPSGTPAVYRLEGPVTTSSFADATVWVEGADRVDCLGSTLAAVPDQDGDGVVDLLVGGRCEGEVHLLSGTGESLVAGDDDLVTFTGPSGESRFGHEMASGDLDGDGVLDVAIAALEPYFFEGSDDGLGFVSVFLGPIEGSRDSSTADATIAAQESDSTSEVVMLGSGLGIGDMDGDGMDDLVVGGPVRSLGDDLRSAGSAFLFLGPVPADRELVEAQVTVLGTTEFGRLGGELDAVHDLDGDGASDLPLGNGFEDINGNGVFLGCSPRLESWLFLGPLSTGTWLATDADRTFRGDTDCFGLQARVAGDTDGDGMPEMLIGNDGDALFLFDLTTGTW